MKGKNIFLKGMSLLLSMVAVATITACANKSGNTNSTTSDTSTIDDVNNNDVEDNSKEVLLYSEGNPLQLLVTHNNSTDQTTYKAGYITYDANGVYLYDVNKNTNTNLNSGENNDFEFYSTNFSEFCGEDELAANTKSLNSINYVLSNIKGYVPGKHHIFLITKNGEFKDTRAYKMNLDALISSVQENDRTAYNYDKVIVFEEVPTYSDEEPEKETEIKE